jgi:hypothetical protein
VFWRLAFFPTYRKDGIAATISSVLDDHNIQSSVLYETLGIFDLFLATWLPVGAFGSIEHALRGSLDAASLQRLEAFTVTHVLSDSTWTDSRGGLREPTAATLADGYDPDLIRRANAAQLTSAEKHYLAEENVLAQVEPSRPDDLTFLTVVASAAYSVTTSTRGRLARHLLDLLEEYEVRDGALYGGTGFGLYLVSGSVPADRFADISALSREVNGLGARQAITARPYTHICVDIDDSGDRLQPEPTILDVDALLVAGESRRVAFEPAARLDWQAWLATRGAETVLSEDRANSGLMRTIVGMLNADGGNVVIGAIDRQSEDGRAVPSGSEFIDALPRRDSVTCLGVEAEYDEEGWDGYRLWLDEAIGSRIDPQPTGAVSSRREALEGKTELCILTVEPRQSTWYYRFLGPAEPVKFYVREGTRTVAYAGSTSDAYKRSRPRMDL